MSPRPTPCPLPTDGSLRRAEQNPALPALRGKTLVGGGVLVVLVVALPPLPAVAATSVTTFGVSAVVLPSPSTCLIGPAGRDTHRSALPRIVSAILVRCTGTLPYEVSLAVEGAADAIEASLRISDRLAASWSYAPFQDIVHLIIRGDTGSRDHRFAADRAAGPTAIAYDRSAAVMPVMPVADADTVTITVRY